MLTIEPFVISYFPYFTWRTQVKDIFSSDRCRVANRILTVCQAVIFTSILMLFFCSSSAVLTSEGIVFITDFSHSKPPSSAGKKVYIASPHASPAHTKPAPAAAPAPTGAKKALNKVKVLITNEKPT